jgi:hypothetical protein
VQRMQRARGRIRIRGGILDTMLVFTTIMNRQIGIWAYLMCGRWAIGGQAAVQKSLVDREVDVWSVLKIIKMDTRIVAIPIRDNLESFSFVPLPLLSFPLSPIYCHLSLLISLCTPMTAHTFRHALPSRSLSSRVPIGFSRNTRCLAVCLELGPDSSFMAGG